MSKFLSVIENLASKKKLALPPEDEALKDIDRKKKNKEILSPQEKELDRLNSLVLKKAKDRLKKQLATEEEDTVAQEPSTDPSPSTDVLSPEGEVYYVDQIKKALFVDLDNVDLSSTEKEIITHDVTPENAKKVAETLKKIIDDFGL